MASQRPGRPTKTKADLVRLVYDLHGGLTKNEAAEVVNTILRTMKTTLLDGRKVKIQKFGVFEVADRQGRSGVDPSNGERIYIPPRKRLSFRPARGVKRAVDGSSGDES
jgi:integration host factor subunit alpha